MSTVERRYTELHRHIDCSLRPQTLAELSQKFGTKKYKDAKDIRENFWITKPLASLNEALDRFVLFQEVLASEEILERIAFECVEDAAAEGISHLELRYSPRFASAVSKIPWENVLNSFLTGLSRGEEKTGVQSALICIVSRGENLGMAEEAIDFAIAHRKNFIAVDLAGAEIGFPCRLYKNVFRKARDAGFPVTIHAGEGCGPENVWEAIDLLGATRIGHGVRSIEDPVLIKRLARDQILLETCPTSNVMTGAVTSFEKHPLPRFLSAGIPCSISTDDPGIFGVTMQDEFDLCKKHCGLSDADLLRVAELSKKFAFLK